MDADKLWPPNCIPTQQYCLTLILLWTTQSSEDTRLNNAIIRNFKSSKMWRYVKQSKALKMKALQPFIENNSPNDTLSQHRRLIKNIAVGILTMRVICGMGEEKSKCQLLKFTNMRTSLCISVTLIHMTTQNMIIQ